MSWALQHVRVTLEDAKTGEIVVIEQRSDGTIDCKEIGRRAKGEGAAKETEGKAAAPKERAAERVKEEARPREEAKPKAEHKEARPKEEAKPRAEARPKEETKPKERKASKDAGKSSKRSLAWRAVKDNSYDGFATKVRHGLFKALHARNTQWALFFEREDAYPAHLGCFLKLEQAKARAQELHDAGWPESEFGEVTKAHIERACPLPGPQSEEKAEMTPTTTPKTEDTHAPPTSPAAAEPTTDEGKDALLMRSFVQAANSILVDDEDDD